MSNTNNATDRRTIAANIKTLETAITNAIDAQGRAAMVMVDNGATVALLETVVFNMRAQLGLLHRRLAEAFANA